MNKDDLIRWATQCKMPYDYVTGEIVQLEKLEAFAKLVAAAVGHRNLGPGEVELTLARDHNGEQYESRYRLTANEILRGPDFQVAEIAKQMDIEMCRMIREKTSP